MPSARRQISWQLTGVVNWIIFEPWGGGGGYSWKLLVGVCRPAHQISDPKIYFFTPVFNSFASNKIKPSVNETNWSSLPARTCALILFISI